MKVFTIGLLLLASVPFFLMAKGQKEEESMMEDSAMENTMMMEDSGDMGEDMETFITYKDPDQAMMLAGEKPTVLFFNASWCPTCKAAREDFTAHKDSLKGINLVLVDYDNSDDLQIKYGVTYQHTFVQIDSTGRALTKWNGGGTDELLMNVMEKEM